MTLKEMKQRTLSLIEEINPDSEYLTDDVDIQAKINYVIDNKCNELSRIKKIAATDTLKVKENQVVNLYEDLDRFYKLDSIKGADYDLFENIVTFNEEGTVRVNYYKVPKTINATTEDDKYKFELTDDVLKIMPFGVAADLLKSDVSSQYGQVYANAYKEALNMLDVRTSNGTVKLEGGLNV